MENAERNKMVKGRPQAEASSEKAGKKRGESVQVHKMNKRAVGTAYERTAGIYLETKGYRILEYNFRNRRGEIDIVARDGSCLVFVEVKYRKDKRAGDPLEAVDPKKQRSICRTAAYYLLIHHFTMDTPCRFDVVAVEGEEIRLVKNAFPYLA